MEQVIIEYWYVDPDAVLEYGTFGCSYDQAMKMISMIKAVFMEDLNKVTISFIPT